MANFNKLALATLMGAGIAIGVSWIGANTGENSMVSKPNMVGPVKSEMSINDSTQNNIDANNLVGRTDLKIRFIDFFGSMRECKEGVQEAEKLEHKRKDLAKSIEGEGKKLEAAVAKFKTESTTLNDAARAKKEQELTKMKRDYENLVQSCEEEMKVAMQQVTEGLAKQVEESVIDLAKREGLDAIIDKMTGRVVYASPKVDFTNKVVQSLNRNYEYKVANSGKSAASKTKVA
jgi:outer membrane protein